MINSDCRGDRGDDGDCNQDGEGDDSEEFRDSGTSKNNNKGSSRTQERKEDRFLAPSWDIDYVMFL